MPITVNRSQGDQREIALVASLLSAFARHGDVVFHQIKRVVWILLGVGVTNLLKFRQRTFHRFILLHGKDRAAHLSEGLAEIMHVAQHAHGVGVIHGLYGNVHRCPRNRQVTVNQGVEVLVCRDAYLAQAPNSFAPRSDPILEHPIVDHLQLRGRHHRDDALVLQFLLVVGHDRFPTV